MRRWRGASITRHRVWEIHAGARGVRVSSPSDIPSREADSGTCSPGAFEPYVWGHQDSRRWAPYRPPLTHTHRRAHPRPPSRDKHQLSADPSPRPVVTTDAPIDAVWKSQSLDVTSRCGFVCPFQPFHCAGVNLPFPASTDAELLAARSPGPRTPPALGSSCRPCAHVSTRWSLFF